MKYFTAEEARRQFFEDVSWRVLKASIISLGIAGLGILVSSILGVSVLHSLVSVLLAAFCWEKSK